MLTIASESLTLYSPAQNRTGIHSKKVTTMNTLNKAQQRDIAKIIVNGANTLKGNIKIGDNDPTLTINKNHQKME